MASCDIPTFASSRVRFAREALLGRRLAFAFLVRIPSFGPGLVSVGQNATGQPCLLSGFAKQLGALFVVELAELVEQQPGLVVADASVDVLGHRLVERGWLYALARLAVARGVAERLHARGVVLAAHAEEDEKERSGAHGRTIAQACRGARTAKSAFAWPKSVVLPMVAARVPWYPKFMQRTAWVLWVISMVGCGAEEAEEASFEAATESSAGTASGTAAPGTDGTDGGSGGVDPTVDETTGGVAETEGSGDPTEDTDDPTGDPPIDPPASCDEVELPVRGGAEIRVSSVADGVVMVEGAGEMSLRQAVSSASAGDTVLLADGTYVLPDADDGGFSGIYITTPDVTLRSESGDAAAVVIDGEYRSHGDGSAPVTIAASGVVVADLTVRRSVFHLIHIWADGDEALIHNVHMLDGGQQFLKSSVNEGTVDAVEVSCSQFRMTDEGRDNVWGYGDTGGNTTCYTGGIDTHNARDWNVHDNLFEGIYCTADGVARPAHGRFPELRDNTTYTGGLSEHAIHMWDSESGTGHTISGNRIHNSARGIGIGLTDTVYGTRVVNNTVFSEHAGSREHDVGIIIERGVGMLVAHNTVFMSHPDAYGAGIEIRWGETSGVTLHGNLSNREIRSRDGAEFADVGNLQAGEDGWFVDAAAGDLHLADCATVDTVSLHDEVTTDMDGAMRIDPTTVGADICE